MDDLKLFLMCECMMHRQSCLIEASVEYDESEVRVRKSNDHRCAASSRDAVGEFYTKLESSRRNLLGEYGGG